MFANLSQYCGICGPRSGHSMFGKEADPVLTHQTLFGGDPVRPAVGGKLQEDQLRGQQFRVPPAPEPYFAAGGGERMFAVDDQADMPTLPAFDDRYPTRQPSLGEESFDSIDSDYEEAVVKCRARLAKQLQQENGRFKREAFQLSSLTRSYSRCQDASLDPSFKEDVKQRQDMQKCLRDLETSEAMARQTGELAEKFNGNSQKAMVPTASGACVKVPQLRKAPRPNSRHRRPDESLTKLYESDDEEECHTSREIVAGSEDTVDKDYRQIQQRLRDIGKFVKSEGPIPRAEPSQVGSSRRQVQEQLLEQADKYRDVMEEKFRRLGFAQADVDEDQTDLADPAKAVRSAVAQYQQLSLERDVFYPMPFNTDGEGMSYEQKQELICNVQQLREDGRPVATWKRSRQAPARCVERLRSPVVVADPCRSTRRPQTVHQDVDVNAIEQLLGCRPRTGDFDLVSI